jgi:hypothetical protein
MGADGDVRAYDALSQHARLADLAALAHALMTSAAEARRSGRPSRRAVDLAAERRLTPDDAATPFGNALQVLDRGPSNADERALARALAAHALAAHRPKDAAEEVLAANDLLWLAAHTPFDALGLLDKALGGDAPRLWAAISEAIRGGLAGVLGFPPPSASAPGSGPAEARSPLVPPAPLLGEMAPAPRGPVATALLAVTGVLLVAHAARLFGKVALAYKTPAEVALSEDGGVRVRWRVELLGRTLRDRDVLVPRAALGRAAREVRFSGATLYAGLLALVLGSYVGVSSFVDGVRAASPALLAAGLAIVALGLSLDFVFTCAVPGARGRCRVLFVPRTGPHLCIGDVDQARADSLLGRLSRP